VLLLSGLDIAFYSTFLKLDPSLALLNHAATDTMAGSMRPSRLKQIMDKLGLKLNLPIILLMIKYVDPDEPLVHFRPFS
jgi:hypothetical protein